MDVFPFSPREAEALVWEPNEHIHLNLPNGG